MTFAPVGAWLSGSHTLALSNQAAGDLVVVIVENNDAGVWATGISGGGVSWSPIGTRFAGSVNARNAVGFAGTVTATGAGTATVTYNGTPTSPHAVGHEYSSTVGSWSLDQQGHVDSAGTNAFASLLPSQAADLYFGYAVDVGSAVAGSTAGYTYNANADGAGNGACFNAACTGTAQAPSWGDSGEAFGLMLLIREGGGGGGGPATFTHVGAKQSPAEANPFSLTTSTPGDFVLLEVSLQGAGVTTAGVSGGNCTWAPLVPGQNLTQIGGEATVWIGTVTAAGTADVTLTFAGGTPASMRITVDEFACSAGTASVVLDNYQVADAGGASTMQTATPAHPGELYWGYFHDTSSSTAGSTPGVVYEIDSFGNGTAYDLSVSSPLTVTWGDSSHNGGIAVLLTAVSAAGSGGVAGKKAAAAGSGAEAFAGPGSVTAKKPAAAGSGSAGGAPVAGTGALGGRKPAAAGSGTEVFTAAGTLAGKKPAVTGTAANGGNAGAGGATSRKAAVSGGGTETFAGGGALTGKKSSAAGAGLAAGGPVTGSAAVVSRKTVIAGGGLEGFAGAGAVTRRKASVAGSGTNGGVAGAGSVAARKPSATGTGAAGPPPPFTVGVLTASVSAGGSSTSTSAPAGMTSTSSGINYPSTNP